MSLTDRQRIDEVDPDLASKYEILDVLGGGGMGRVLRARHRQLKTLVAIKLLQQDLKASDAVTRFLREARAAAHIRSAHVARVMDTGILRNGQPYIVMEYLRGQDLARLIATQGRLAMADAIGFILQALEAIAEAHSLQIIHRDIKPGNLFATRIAGGETFIKVLDFGLAKTNQTLDTLDPGVTERGAVLGTPSYMSPEQFINAQEVDARTDIWGLGTTLFELLTGLPPFTGKNLPQIYTAVMHRPIPSLRSAVPELPVELDEVIATCLTRERELRYGDVAELASALAPFAKDSDRDHVDRIHRVIDGDPNHDALSASQTAGADGDLAGRLQGAAEGDAIHSSFTRTSRRGLADPPRASPDFVARYRPALFGLALLAVAVLVSVAWALNRKMSLSPGHDQTAHSELELESSQLQPASRSAVHEFSNVPTNTEMSGNLEPPSASQLANTEPEAGVKPPASQAEAMRSARPGGKASASTSRKSLKKPASSPPSSSPPPSIYDIYP